MAKTKITSETFSYCESAQSDLYAIKLKKGRYKGVIFTFGKVHLNEDKENNNLSVNFQYKIEDSGKRYTEDELTANPKFKEYLSYILRFILEEEFGEYAERPAADIKEDL